MVKLFSNSVPDLLEKVLRLVDFVSFRRDFLPPVHQTPIATVLD